MDNRIDELIKGYESTEFKRMKLNKEVRDIDDKINAYKEDLKIADAKRTIALSALDKTKKEALKNAEDKYKEEYEKIKDALDSKDDKTYKEATAKLHALVAEKNSAVKAANDAYDQGLAAASKESDDLKLNISELESQKARALGFIGFCKDAWDVPEHMRRNKADRDAKADEVLKEYLEKNKDKKVSKSEPAPKTKKEPVQKSAPVPGPAQKSAPIPEPVQKSAPVQGPAQKSAPVQEPAPKSASAPVSGTEEKKSPKNERTEIKDKLKENDEIVNGILNKPLAAMDVTLYSFDLVAVSDYAAATEIISNMKGADWVKNGYSFEDKRLSERQNLNMNSAKDTLAYILKQAARETKNGNMTIEEFGELRKMFLATEDGKADSRGLKLIVAEKYITEARENIIREASRKNVSISDKQLETLSASHIKKIMEFAKETEKFEEHNVSKTIKNNSFIKDSTDLAFFVDVTRRGNLTRDEYKKAKEIARNYRGMSRGIKAGPITRLGWLARDLGFTKSKFDEPLLLTDGKQNAKDFARNDDDKYVDGLETIQTGRYNLDLTSKDLADRKALTQNQNVEFLNTLEGDTYTNRLYELRQSVDKEDLTLSMHKIQRQLPEKKLASLMVPSIYTDKTGKHFEKWMLLDEDKETPVEYFRRYTRKNDNTKEYEEYFVSYKDLPDNPLDEELDITATEKNADKVSKTADKAYKEMIESKTSYRYNPRSEEAKKDLAEEAKRAVKKKLEKDKEDRDDRD